jgi:hypothetical protein
MKKPAEAGVCVFAEGGLLSPARREEETLNQIDLDPDDYARHSAGHRPLKIRRPWLFRTLKAIVVLMVVTIPFLAALAAIRSSPHLWLASQMVLIGLVSVTLLYLVLLPLPRK